LTSASQPLPPDVDADIFGQVRLGYVVVGSLRLDQWQRFATEAIGLHLAQASPDLLALRMDDHARRLLVERDAAEDVVALGWQLQDAGTLQAVMARLAGHGVRTEQIDGERAAARGVEALHRFTGPKGLSIELFTRPLLDDTPLQMPCSGFRTGAGGMGHISLMSREPQRSVAFWQQLFDARLSDRIELAAGSRVVLDVNFLRLNQRHHSVAIAATRGVAVDMFRTRIQHLNLEVATLDDLSAAYERCQQLGCRFARGVGQHPNDRELSFYVVTPSGFDLEIGWDALTVDEQVWQAGATYPNMSTWGHDIPGLFGNELSFGHLLRSARSLLRREFLPW